jgi:hypothetical protein
LNAGDGTFGGTHTSGEFARGTAAGEVGNGSNVAGIYAFDVSNSGGASPNYALGNQSTPNALTPGTFTLRLQNNSGQTLTGFSIAYDVIVLNTEDGSSSVNFSWSADDATYTPVGSLAFNTPGTENASPVWTSTGRSAAVTGLNIPNSGLFYLQWTTDANTSGNTLDEFAFDNISFSVIPEPGTILPLGTLLGFALLGHRRRR